MSTGRRITVSANTRRSSRSSADEEETPGRVSSVRVTRRQENGGAGSATRTSTRRITSVRTRRATPGRVTGRTRRNSEQGSSENDNDNIRSAEMSYQNDGQGRIDATLATNGRRNNNNNLTTGLCWYERLMPEFLLNMTSPITGYENSIDSDVEDDEYEILERQRVKRNRRIRRRLAGLLLVAAAATAFVYARGRMGRRLGVQAAVNTMAGKIENGISKIQDRLTG